ncbi:hypothetical protein SDC9_110223 [bioreactor metagenome]|uniref:Uncharacterized protein n=1 Tax=bioreactor metagenome TaxID=1076179 RepID=A0A645BJG8_9ZZZZ
MLYKNLIRQLLQRFLQPQRFLQVLVDFHIAYIPFQDIPLRMIRRQKHLFAGVPACSESEAITRIQYIHYVVRHIIACPHFGIIILFVIFRRKQHIKLFIGDVNVCKFFKNSFELFGFGVDQD